MRFRVKPHSGILSVFLRRRGQAARAIRLFADASLLPRPQHSFSPADLPSPAAGGGGGERMLTHAVATLHDSFAGKGPCVGWRLHGPSDTPGQPSIRATPATAPPPFTLYAQAYSTPNPESTHRTNGALAGHPAAERRLVPTGLRCFTITRSVMSTILHRGRLLRMTPRR